MNIFEEYKNKLILIIKKAEEDKLLILPENLDGINNNDIKASKLRQLNFSEDDIKAFNILSLNIGTEWTIIRDKFKKLVKRFHPDKNSGNKKYEEKLKIITLAYTQLKRSYKK